MPDFALYTREAAQAKALEIKTALAASKMRFYKGPFVPTQFTTKAQLVAQECDFDGYTAGGYAIAAWNGPVNDPAGGQVLSSPAVNPVYGPVGDPPKTNTVGGYWIEDTTGDVRFVVVYSPNRPMGQVGDGWTEVAQIVEGRNALPALT